MNIYEGSTALHVRPIAAIRLRAQGNGKTAGKGPGRLPIIALADYRVTRDALCFDDRDDLVRTRIDDEDLVADQNVVVAAPLGIDHEHFRWQRIEMHAIRHAGTHAHRHVEFRRFHLVAPDDGGDLAALLGR